MDTQPDFRELRASFHAHHVEFLVVGGYALAFHGAPRFTGDLDLLVRPEPGNARRVIEALQAFGFTSPDLTEDDFIRPEQVIQLGVPPVRVDLLTSISGVTWDEAHAGRVSGHYGDVSVDYIGRDEFIANKRASGRARDMADLERLGEA